MFADGVPFVGFMRAARGLEKCLPAPLLLTSVWAFNILVVTAKMLFGNVWQRTVQVDGHAACQSLEDTEVVALLLFGRRSAKLAQCVGNLK